MCLDDCKYHYKLACSVAQPSSMVHYIDMGYWFRKTKYWYETKFIMFVHSTIW